MGIGFVIIIWAILGSLLLACYFLLSHFETKFAFASRLKSIFVPCVIAIAIPVAIMTIISFAQNQFPSYVFKSSFGFDAPSDVTELKGGKFVFGDSGSIELEFRANKETIQRIVTSRFLESNEQIFKSQCNCTLKPDSTQRSLVEGEQSTYYEAPHFDDSFAASRALLSYNEATRETRFFWTGVD